MFTNISQWNLSNLYYDYSGNESYVHLIQIQLISLSEKEKYERERKNLNDFAHHSTQSNGKMGEENLLFPHFSCASHT